MHHIINSCTNMSKIYCNNDSKSCTTWSFPSYSEDEVQWETCWHVWQIYRALRAINSLHADAATRVEFTETVPTKFHLWFRSGQFLIYSLVWIAPFLKENQKLPHADDARCIGSQTDISLENTLHHPYPITPSPRARTETQSQEITLRTGGVTNAWVIKACQVALVFLQRSIESLDSPVCRVWQVHARVFCKRSMMHPLKWLSRRVLQFFLSFSERPFTTTYESRIRPANFFTEY